MDSPTRPDGEYLKAQEVSHLLRIKPQTLYAYVSRGWIRRIRSDRHRGFLYLREDVERLEARTRARAGRGILKGSAPHWSEPVVQTAITDITDDGPAYRGHPAIELAGHGERFESVAEMIWTGMWNDDGPGWESAALTETQLALLKAFERSRRGSPGGFDPLRGFALLVLSAAIAHEGGDDIRDGSTIAGARDLLRRMAGCLGFLRPAGGFVVADGREPIAAHIARALGLDTDEPTQRAIDLALVLLADHQLTPQTVAARLAASSGATLYHCLNAALSVHSSSRARRACDRIEDLLLSSRDSAQFCQQLESLRRSAGRAPGFDHPLYPKGDPRARLMIDVAQSHIKRRRRSQRLAEHVARMQSETGIRPSVEAGLVLLCHALAMPNRSAGALLVIARCAGWVGHVIEQRTAGLMLRPRARYRG